VIENKNCNKAAFGMRTVDVTKQRSYLNGRLYPIQETFDSHDLPRAVVTLHVLMF